eukprot:scaffold1659_cov255-Pinguiococcus_pyrenoidosus.AAC.42
MTLFAKAYQLFRLAIRLGGSMGRAGCGPSFGVNQSGQLVRGQRGEVSLGLPRDGGQIPGASGEGKAILARSREPLSIDRQRRRISLQIQAHKRMGWIPPELTRQRQSLQSLGGHSPSFASNFALLFGPNAMHGAWRRHRCIFTASFDANGPTSCTNSTHLAEARGCQGARVLYAVHIHARSGAPGVADDDALGLGSYRTAQQQKCRRQRSAHCAEKGAID